METEPLQEYQLVERDDCWSIPIIGQHLSRFKVDMQLTLEFLEPAEEETSVWIGGEFKVALDVGEHFLSAEQREKISPVFGLLGRTVESALAYKTGLLEIVFREGGKLTIAPDQDYESWGVTGVRWLRIVCTPGGELAVWLADLRQGKTRKQSEAEKDLARRSREITTLINILEPDQQSQPMQFSNELSVIEELGTSEDVLNKRLQGYFGESFHFSTAQPINKLWDQIKKALPDWPNNWPRSSSLK
jgi:hypothetical protein